MIYKFPHIANISDVLWAIEDCENINVTHKEGYTVINYRMLDDETFPLIDSSAINSIDNLKSSIRRECRGMIFCAKTGDIIRRPFHKFFNLGEREETLSDNISLSKSHVILEKLDGSMIAPFMLDNEIRYGTKMGVTDVAAPVEAFVKDNPDYTTFCNYLLRVGVTPIFEWCSNKQRIVLNNKEDLLILTAARNMITGEYISLDLMKEHLINLNIDSIPIVKTFSNSKNDIEEFADYVKHLIDVEGFVVRFNDGHMIKLKCDWYIQIHKTKEKILFDRHIVNMILDNTLDDIKPHLQQEDLENITTFENGFVSWFNETSIDINDFSNHLKETGVTRKDFATGNLYKKTPDWYRSMVFSLWEENSIELARKYLTDYIRKKTGSNSNYDSMQSELFPELKFNSE